MKKRIEDFALFGGNPVFSKPLHVAQVNLPPWPKVESAFRGIFARRYFANHGPLVQELDNRFAEFVGARHAVCVTNGTVALMILAKALDLSGEVIVPAFTFPATVQALSWAGLKPVLCDVDVNTHMITPETIGPHISSQTRGIMGVHVWGRPCEPERLQSFASKNGLSLFFDACHGIGCSSNGRFIGTFGAGEAFSFHATKIINGGEGGCITTNDDNLAKHLKTIRNFHPSETFAKVPLRLNGKMSEAQAALALLSIDQYEQNAAANKNRYDVYKNGLDDLPGISLLQYEEEEDHNYQYIVAEIAPESAGIDRDGILTLLAAENVFCRRHFYPGIHRMPPYDSTANKIDLFSGTEYLCQRVLQLPTSQAMTDEDVARICELIRGIQRHAPKIVKRMSGQQ